MTSNNGDTTPSQPSGISKIIVGGFKALRETVEVEVRPLTILAGANSSGKSSVMQPLLLMKQTLEAPYDPGPLLLNGPNVKFTLVKQFLNNLNSKREVTIGIDSDFDAPDKLLITKLDFQTQGTISVLETQYSRGVKVYPEITPEEIVAIGEIFQLKLGPGTEKNEIFDANVMINWGAFQDRCFLDVGVYWKDGSKVFNQGMLISFSSIGLLKSIIHIPGLRGNPERAYPLTASEGPYFPGLFQLYTASIIHKWQQEEQIEFEQLVQQLSDLGLTSAVSVNRLDDTQLEVKVGRPKTLGHETVSIADVGLGVSQVLPVLVGLLTAKPGQLVYIEQPEIHLHPKAQRLLAQAFAQAAQRGVRVVVETHSALFLLGVQTLIAQGQLDPALVKLHWFSLDGDGQSRIASHDLDSNGAYGDWPVDFDAVDLESQDEYLSAVEAKMLG